MFGINNSGRKSEENLRCERVVIHVTLKEKELLNKIAAANGMNVSTFIRTFLIYNKFNSFFEED